MNDQNRILSGVAPEYVTKITPSFYYRDLYYNGYLIEEIEMDHPLDIQFDIEIEKKRWGLDGINVYNIQSYPVITLVVTCYGSNDKIKVFYPVKLPIIWDGVRIENSDRSGGVSIEGIEITLDVKKGHSNLWTNNLLGLDQLVVKDMVINVQTF